MTAGGKIIKTTFVTQLFNAEAIFYKEFTGVADAQFEEEMGIGLPGPGLKEAGGVESASRVASGVLRECFWSASGVLRGWRRECFARYYNVFVNKTAAGKGIL